MADPVPRAMSLRTKWIATLLAVLSALSLAGILGGYRLAVADASRSARGWLEGGVRRAPTYYGQILQRLHGEGALLARSPRALAAFRGGGAEGLAAELSLVAPPGRGSFWVAVSATGALLGTDAPPCAEAVLGLLRRSGLEGGGFLLCGGTPALAIAVPVGPDVRRGWLVLGERLGAGFVDDLARLTGAEVVLWGPSGQLVGTFRDQGDRRVAVGFGEGARRILASSPSGYFGRHELSLPGYRGYASGGGDAPIAAGWSRLPCFVFIDELGASTGELPVRLVLAVPEEVLLGGARTTSILASVVVAVALLLIGRVGWRLAGGFSRPLTGLRAAAERVAAGERGLRVRVETDDELGRLAQAFNEMLASIERTQEQRLQAATLGAVGQLAAGLAHELNNPLGIILGFAQGMERRLPEGDPARFPTQSIVRETLRCRELVQRLVTFSRAGVLAVEPVDLNALIAQTLPLLERRARDQGVGVTLQLAPEAPVLEASRAQLQQVLINLGTNALDAMPGGGTLTVRTSLLQPYGARLEVVDTGIGIPEAIRPRIFEPFFTTKPVGQGTGLGLSLVYEIVARHQGNIQVESQAGQGTKMVISLPGRGRAPPAPAPAIAVGGGAEQ